MKVMLLVRVTLVIVLAGVSLSAQNLGVELQRITQQATVTGDLRAAIDGYKKIVARAGSNREVAAQALVRMADAHQKLGDTESKKIYEQLLRDYADQKDAVAIARTRLRQSELAQRQGDKAFRMVWSVGVGKSGGNIAQDGRRLSYYDGCNAALHDLADGTNRLLTKPGECTDWLAISRDGSQVAYNGRTAQTTYSELRLASLQGTGVPSSRRLYGGEDLNYIGPNDWSPDGKWIAVTVDRKDRTTQLGIVAVSDGSLRILKSTSWKTYYAAFFSPDGRYVAFDVPASETTDQRDVFVTDAEGSRQIPAVVHSANDRVMGWSPDGQYLLFSSDRRGSTDLWALSFSEGAPRGTPA